MKMRIIHRYLGFFLAGIMAIYALSGVVLIFRNTDFLKQDTVAERTLKPNLEVEQLGKEIRQRNLRVIKAKNDILFFEGGEYNRQTGLVTYIKKELPYVLDKMTHLHKANTNAPLFWLNIIFGFCLLFFVISSFWMFIPGTSVFRKGLIFTAFGVILSLVLLFV